MNTALHREQKGFTLIELLVVIATIAIPIGLLLPADRLLHPFKPESGTRLHNPEVVIANLPAGTHYAFVSQFDGSASSGTPYTLEIEVFGGPGAGRR